MTTTADVSKEFEVLKADIADVRKDLAMLVGSIRDLAEGRAQVAYSRVDELGRRVRDRVGRTRDTLEREVETRPFASIVTCFGIGFVLGMLLDRRR